MKQSLINALMFIPRVLKKIFIQPFIWYFRLPLKRKLIVGLITFLCGSLFLISLPVLFFFSVSSGMWGAMPSDEELTAVKNYQASEVYSRDSVLLGRYFVENRSDAIYEEVSPHLFNAIIATEDARFYEHTGVDTRSLLRVVFKSVLLRKKTGGGSTISQQLAKNIFGRNTYGWFTMPVNKIKEIIIANQLERIYNKKEILMLYVNTVSFGEDTYGIKTSSQRFFNVRPDQLQPEQAAVLAGMLKSPSYYNPRKHPDNALRRRNIVLEQMSKYGYLTPEMSTALQAKPIVLHYNRDDTQTGTAAYFREKVRLDAEAILKGYSKPDGSAYDLYTDGLKIYTSIHSRLQSYGEAAAKEQLQKMQPQLLRDLKANGFFRKNYALVINEVKKTNRYKDLQEKNYSEKEIMNALRKPDSMTMYSPYGDEEVYLSAFDSVQRVLSTLQAGFLAVNPHNGQVLAWVGGADYKYTQYDHIQAQRQVGSLFKPIVYASALQSGLSPCEFMANQKVTYTNYEDWSPENANEEYKGRYSVTGALANSVNSISVEVCMKSGIQNVIRLARAMGISGELPAKPSIALGTADLSLLDITGAYTAFANDGSVTSLQCILSVRNAAGEELYHSKPDVKTVFSKEIAHTMTNMLRHVVDKGTAHNLRDRYGFSGMIAGKTGTSQEHRDGWFMGYTSGLLAGVWVGADNPAIHFSTITQGAGSASAMPVWAGFYKRVANDAELRYLVTKPFPYENDILCEMYKEDTFVQKLFQRKNKVNSSTGMEETKRARVKKKRMK